MFTNRIVSSLAIILSCVEIATAGEYSGCSRDGDCKFCPEPTPGFQWYCYKQDSGLCRGMYYCLQMFHVGLWVFFAFLIAGCCGACGYGIYRCVKSRRKNNEVVVVNQAGAQAPPPPQMVQPVTAAQPQDAELAPIDWGAYFELIGIPLPSCC